MNPLGQSEHTPMNINQLQDAMTNIVYNVCSIVTMPVETALRPWYGSRYFPPAISVLSAVLMMVLPLFFSLTEAYSRFLPIGRPAVNAGLFGLVAFSKLYFFGGFLHGLRTWRRMIQMEREKVSTFEGPPLPFFRILPGSFFLVRIIYEPLFVFGLALILPNYFILQPSAAHYLMLVAVCLAMKEFVAWQAQWTFIRGLLDMRNAGPIIAGLVDNSATESDLATIHLASLPKDIPDELRRDTAAHIARAFGTQDTHSK